MSGTGRSSCATAWKAWPPNSSSGSGSDQYIEISGVPDGLYVIETVANPIRTVHETTLDDNTARATIRLSGDTVVLVGDGVRTD
jgi:Lysyl oxidase